MVGGRGFWGYSYKNMLVLLGVLAYACWGGKMLLIDRYTIYFLFVVYGFLCIFMAPIESSIIVTGVRDWKDKVLFFRQLRRGFESLSLRSDYKTKKSKP